MIVLVGIGLTWMLNQVFWTWREGKSPEWFKDILDTKPFNCELCISVWMAFLFFLTTDKYPAFLIPVSYDIFKSLKAKYIDK